MTVNSEPLSPGRLPSSCGDYVFEPWLEKTGVCKGGTLGGLGLSAGVGWGPTEAMSGQLGAGGMKASTGEQA